MEEEKKIAAVMAAVTAYIRDGETALLRRLAAKPKPLVSKAPQNSWAMAGRLDQMQAAQHVSRKL